MNKNINVLDVIGLLAGINTKSFKAVNREIESWSVDKLISYQVDRVRNILVYAYKQTDYYSKLFNELGFNPHTFSHLDQLTNIPPVSKTDIKENFNAFVSKEVSKLQYSKYHTGGTTGVAFKYFLDKQNWLYNWLSLNRAYSWAGYNFSNDKIGILAGGSLLPGGKIPLAKKIWKSLLKYYPLSITLLDDNAMFDYYTLIKNKNIKFIRGYPTSIFTFAEFVIKNNLTLKLESVITTAEMLYDYQRILISKAFNCEVYNHYGCKDGTINACECEEHSGLHISSEMSYVELIKNASDGLGQIAVTSFWNRSMPFIRYMPGDLAADITFGCNCGRNLPKLIGLEGRSSDIIKFSNGKTLNGLSLPFEDFDEHLHQFQIIERETDKIEILIVKKDAFDKSFEEQILKTLYSQIGSSVEVTITYVDKINMPSSNKFRYVISRGI